MVIPAMDRIDEHLATSAESGDYSAAIRSALAIGKQTLNRYYNKTDHSEVYRIAMGESPLISLYICYFLTFVSVLHPRHKLHYFKVAGWEEEWVEAAHVIVREEFDCTYAFMDLDLNVEVTEVCPSMLSRS